MRQVAARRDAVDLQLFLFAFDFYLAQRINGILCGIAQLFDHGFADQQRNRKILGHPPRREAVLTQSPITVPSSRSAKTLVKYSVLVENS